MRRRLVTLLLPFAAVAAPLFATAQTASPEQLYPTRPIRLVVPYPPGGGADMQARLLAGKLAQRLGQPVVIDNRGGASGIIGMEIVATAAADGYTIIIAPVGTWAVTPYLYKLSYDVLKDFAPLIRIATTPGLLVVHPSVPASTVKELIALARQRPAELAYGSGGVGGTFHIAAVLFTSMAKIKMVHVPYKGAAPALNDLIAGRVQLSFNNILPTLPHIKSGRLRALATTGPRRADVLPDLPTIAEAGVPGYESSSWSAAGAPSHTPHTVIARLNKELGAVLDMPEVQRQFASMGSTTTGGTASQFGDYLKAEVAKFGKLLKDPEVAAEFAH